MYRPTKQGYISYYSLSSINIQDSTRVVDPLPVEQRYLHRSFAERPPQYQSGWGLKQRGSVVSTRWKKGFWPLTPYGQTGMA